MWRYIKCTYCDKNICADEKVEHELMQCELRPEKCQNCKCTVSRLQNEKLMRLLCPKRLVTCIICKSSCITAQQLSIHQTHQCRSKLLECTNNGCDEFLVVEKLLCHVKTKRKFRQVRCKKCCNTTT